MNWLTVAVEAKFAWPTEIVEANYLGNTYILNPETDELAQSVSMRYPESMDIDSARLHVNRFLSALSWAEQSGVRDLFAIGTGGPVAPKVGKSNMRFVAHRFKADYLPQPKDEKAKRALALFREAATVESPAYSFLGFFKIFNILFSSGAKQKEWINAHLSAVTEARAKRRLMEIQKEHKDIGEYLYVQGRCAVAHAFSEPAIDPDEPLEVRRLSEDLPLVKDLASVAVQKELGLISKDSYHAAHLYELQGFVDVLGQTTANSLREGKSLPEGLQLKIPNLSVRLRDQPPFEAYENLIPISVDQHESQLVIHLHSEDDILHLVLILDFSKWRLVFDPFECVSIRDDNTPRPLLVESQTAMFAKGKYLNGEIEIYDSERGILLARADPFIPTNVDLSATARNMERASEQALAEAERRLKLDA